MKDKDNKKLILTIISIITLASLTIGASYAFIFRSSTSTNTYSITTDNLDSTITFTEANFSMSPMTDSNGLAQSTYGLVNINKTNDYSVFYSLNIGYTTVGLPSGKTTSDLIPMEYLKVALYTVNGSTLSSSPVIGPVTIADLTMASVSSNHYNDYYSLYQNSFAEGNDSQKYAIKVWLDENTPLTYDGKIVYLNLDITEEAKVNKTFYNISGTVKNGSTGVSGAVVSLNNGQLTATSTSGGNYTLSNVPDGLYDVTITYNNTKYSTTLNIVQGSEIKVSTTASSTGTSGTYLQASASNKNTTVYKILKKNSNLNNSNNSATSTYTIPASYTLTGTESLDTVNITGINMAIASNEITVSKS